MRVPEWLAMGGHRGEDTPVVLVDQPSCHPCVFCVWWSDERKNRSSVMRCCVGNVHGSCDLSANAYGHVKHSQAWIARPSISQGRKKRRCVAIYYVN
jgi:hypothetical protein